MIDIKPVDTLQSSTPNHHLKLHQALPVLHKLGALKIEIYKTNEEYVKTIWGNTSNGLLSPRSGRYYSNTYTYEGTPGVSYYAVVTICAGTVTDYDTREITTSTVRAPY